MRRKIHRDSNSERSGRWKLPHNQTHFPALSKPLSHFAFLIVINIAAGLSVIVLALILLTELAKTNNVKTSARLIPASRRRNMSAWYSFSNVKDKKSFT
jgi:hypothetical protein